MAVPDSARLNALSDLRELVRDVVVFLGPVTFGSTGVSAVASDDLSGIVLKNLPHMVSPNTWLNEHADLVASTCTDVLSSLDVEPVADVIAVPPPPDLPEDRRSTVQRGPRAHPHVVRRARMSSQAPMATRRPGGAGPTMRSVDRDLN